MQHLLFIAINSVQLSGLFVSAYVISHCAICKLFSFLLDSNKKTIITRKMRANQSNSNCKAKQKTKSVIKCANNSNKLNKLPMTFSHRTNGTTTKLLKNVFTFTSARVCVCDSAVTHWLAVRNRLFQQIEKKAEKNYVRIFRSHSFFVVCSVQSK